MSRKCLMNCCKNNDMNIGNDELDKSVHNSIHEMNTKLIKKKVTFMDEELYTTQQNHKEYDEETYHNCIFDCLFTIFNCNDK
jgi:hypothetical protein